MQSHTNILSKKISYAQHPIPGKIDDLEHDQETIRLRTELQRYKSLHEDTAQKTSYMKVNDATTNATQETINQLVGEIEKLNDIITSLDEQVQSLRNQLMTMTVQCDEQKSEKVQLLKFLQQYQLEHQSSRIDQTQEMVISKHDQLEKELISIKTSYEQLTKLHQTEIKKLEEEVSSEKQRCQEVQRELKMKINQNAQNVMLQTQTRVSNAIEQLEKQLSTMGNMLDQKQEEIDRLKQPHIDRENQMEELQGQVQHFKEQLRRTQAEFNQYRNQMAQKDPAKLHHEQHEQQLMALRKQVSFLEDQNKMLRQNHDDTQINTLLKDLSSMKAENTKLKDRVLKVNQLELQLVELASELKKARDKMHYQTNIREASPQRVEGADDRISGLLNVVQSLQVKNEQLQQYLSCDQSPYKHPQPTVTVRKEIQQQRIHSEQAMAFSPTRQLFHRSTPNMNLRMPPN